MGEYENAREYLKKFNTDSKIASPAITSLIGVCYVELGDVRTGVDYFKKAALKANSETLSPVYLKRAAGFAYENLKDYKEALEIYNTIKNKYPNSQEAVDIDKYIERASVALK